MWAVRYRTRYYTFNSISEAKYKLDTLSYRPWFKANIDTTYICRVEVKEVVKKKPGIRKLDEMIKKHLEKPKGKGKII